MYEISNFNQYFASGADYILFSRFVYKNHHLGLSINIAVNQTKSGMSTAGTIKNNFKGKIERLIGGGNSFSLIIPLKRIPECWQPTYIF